MRNYKTLSLALDNKLRPLRNLRMQPPARGWARSIREAIGMTKAQLATRLQVSGSTINMLERSEARGAITLASLERLAEGLDCELIYALKPKNRRRIEEMVHERAESMVTPGGPPLLRLHLVTILSRGGRRQLWR